MENEQRYREILASIERQIPGKFRLSVAEVADLMDYAPGTVYNRIAEGSPNPFPIRFTRAGGRPKALIHDVARFLAGM